MSSEEELSNRQITLCVFPHLKQVIVVDGRPDEPRVLEINVSDILDASFLDEVKDTIEKIVDIEDMVLADLAAIPQQVEGSIKFNVISRIIELIDSESEHDIREGMLGVLFFSGDIIWVSPSKWRESLAEILGKRLPQHELDELLDRLEGMVEAERRSLGSERPGGQQDEAEFDLGKVLSGEAEGIVTLWESEGE